MYTDELLNRINESGIGCHISHLSFAGLGYADDVGILSPSIEALHELLHICEKYADEFNVIFNAKKTMCVYQRPCPAAQSSCHPKWVAFKVDQQSQVFG